MYEMREIIETETQADIESYHPTTYNAYIVYYILYTLHIYTTIDTDTDTDADTHTRRSAALERQGHPSHVIPRTRRRHALDQAIGDRDISTEREYSIHNRETTLYTIYYILYSIYYTRRVGLKRMR